MSETTFVIKDTMKKDEWDRFVYHNPNGNVLQTPEMFEVYKRTKRYEPIFLSAVDESDNILAGLLAVAIREFGGFIGSFSARSVIHGGPLYVENGEGITALKILMEHYDKIASKKALYTEIRNIWNISNISSVFNKAGYEYEDHVNFLINTNRSPEKIFLDFKRDKKRAVKKAKEFGGCPKIADSREEIESFHEILMETYKTAGLPLADKTLFFSVFDVLCKKGKAKVFLAKRDEEIIAGRLILCYKTIIFDWYAGVKRNALSYHPNEFLVWHVLKWGAENGYHTFDFGGAGKPDEEYGVRDFKKQFGGKLVNYGRYKKVHSPIKMKFAEKGFSIYRKMLIK